MRPRARAALAAVLVAMGAAGCVGRTGGEPVPRALARYLEALSDGRLAAAYELTQLDDLSQSSRSGGSLSRAHFDAFYSARPVRRFTVGQVTRLEIRESINAKGTPFYEVDVTLVHEDGPRTAVFTVTDAGVVQVEPVRVLVRPPAGSSPKTLFVDGISVPATSAPGGPAGTLAILVLDGPHSIRIGATTARIETSPMQVLDGPASVAKPYDVVTFAP